MSYCMLHVHAHGVCALGALVLVLVLSLPNDTTLLANKHILLLYYRYTQSTISASDKWL